MSIRTASLRTLISAVVLSAALALMALTGAAGADAATTSATSPSQVTVSTGVTPGAGASAYHVRRWCRYSSGYRRCWYRRVYRAIG